jgi:hypothetical protein
MAYLLTMPSVMKATHWKHFCQWRIVWCLAIVAVAGIQHLLSGAGDLSATLGDTDDATRLVQVRLFLDGAGWFNTQLPQIGAPDSLYSHWSRLVDLPLAILIGGLSIPFGAEWAELMTRAIWPLLLLLAMVLLVVREAERAAGYLGGLIAGILILASAFVQFQFMPGRIDHHNVQILCIAGGLILLPRAIFSSALAPAVGMMLGAGLVVGFEALVLCGFVLGLAAVLCCFVAEMRNGTTRVVTWCAATVAVGFVATTAPERWSVVVCDVVSINLVALVGLPGVTLWALHRFVPRANGFVWLSGLALGGGTAVLVFGLLEPACLAGPMGQVDPRVGPIWLDRILEVQGFFTYALKDPKVGFAYLVTALLALGVLGSKLRAKFTAQIAFQLAIVAAAVGYGLIYVRLMPYAMWIAVPVIAVWIAQLPAIGPISQYTVRLGAIVMFNSSMLLLAGQVAANALLGDDVAEDSPRGAIAGCERRAGMRQIGKLKPGLVVADIDLGPHIVAHSRHRVLAAPYHRIDRSILALYDILKASPEAAQAKLKTVGANYVVLCAKPPKDSTAEPDETFAGQLRRGTRLDYLAPIDLGGNAGLLKAWRVLPNGR